jgi:hypothetical protein
MPSGGAAQVNLPIEKANETSSPDSPATKPNAVSTRAKLQLVTLSEHLFGCSAFAITGRVLIGDRMAGVHDCTGRVSVSLDFMQVGSVTDVSHHHLQLMAIIRWSRAL